MQNDQIGQLQSLAADVDDNHTRRDLLGSHHPAIHPEYFTAANGESDQRELTQVRG